jgi:hypothetical protein
LAVDRKFAWVREACTSCCTTNDTSGLSRFKFYT